MGDLVREGEADGVGALASDLLEWMGAAFGDAVQRAYRNVAAISN
jgi:hypothetical protein